MSLWSHFWANKLRDRQCSHIRSNFSFCNLKAGGCFDGHWSLVPNSCCLVDKGSWADVPAVNPWVKVVNFISCSSRLKWSDHPKLPARKEDSYLEKYQHYSWQFRIPTRLTFSMSICQFSNSDLHFTLAQTNFVLLAFHILSQSPLWSLKLWPLSI